MDMLITINWMQYYYDEWTVIRLEKTTEIQKEIIGKFDEKIKVQWRKN